MAYQQPSLREQIRLFKRSLYGEKAKKFDQVYQEACETKKIKDAFRLAKEAANLIKDNEKI